MFVCLRAHVGLWHHLQVTLCNISYDSCVFVVNSWSLHSSPSALGLSDVSSRIFHNFNTEAVWDKNMFEQITKILSLTEDSFFWYQSQISEAYVAFGMHQPQLLLFKVPTAVFFLCINCNKQHRETFLKLFM